MSQPVTHTEEQEFPPPGRRSGEGLRSIARYFAKDMQAKPAPQPAPHPAPSQDGGGDDASNSR